MSDDNAEAWRVFSVVSSRGAVELGVSAVVFERMTAAMDADDVEALAQRLGILYDVLAPKPQESE